jgi:hypothetical protein
MRLTLLSLFLTFFVSINVTSTLPVLINNPITDTKVTPIACIPHFVNNNTCDDCITLVTDFEKNKERFNNTITHILEDIKMVCKNISSPSAKECIFVINVIEQFDKVIFNSTDPHKVCEMLHLC